MTLDRDKICREALEGIDDPANFMRRVRIAADGVKREMRDEPEHFLEASWSVGTLNLGFKHGEIQALYHIVRDLAGDPARPDIPEGIRTCGHSLMTGYRFFPLGKRARAAGVERDDIEYVLGLLQGEPTDSTEARICKGSVARDAPGCEDGIPSMIRGIAERGKQQKAATKKRDKQRITHLQGLLELKGETYRCDECESIWEAVDLVQVRWCPHCEALFNGSDNGRNCETCNRPFTRNVTERGCPDCLAGEDEEGCSVIGKDEIEAALDEARGAGTK